MNKLLLWGVLFLSACVPAAKREHTVLVELVGIPAPPALLAPLPVPKPPPVEVFVESSEEGRTDLLVFYVVDLLEYQALLNARFNAIRQYETDVQKRMTQVNEENRKRVNDWLQHKTQ